MKPNVVADIKAAAHLEAFDFNRAEDRAAFDAWLRAQLVQINDQSVRTHAAELLKVWRSELFGIPPLTDPAILSRLEAIEAFLGLSPRPREEEITSLKPKGATR